MRNLVVAILLLKLTACSWTYARLTYEFVPLAEDSRIVYEPGAEDLAKLAHAHFAAGLSQVEQRQYVPFRDIRAIRIYVFNNRKHYAAFSHASVLSRASSTTNEIYLSEKLRDRIDTLPGILTHELSHVHIRQYVGTFRYVSDIPGWFLEGLAVSVSAGAGAENVTPGQAQTAIREGHRFEPDDSGSLTGPKSAHSYGLQPHMYYRQTGMFVAYLIGSSPEGFRAALGDIREGARFRGVWKTHYGQTIMELWHGYVNTIGVK